MSRLYLEREQLAQIIKAELHHHHSHCRSIAQSTERIVEKIYETAEKKPSKKRKSGKSGWDAWKKKKAEDTAVSCLNLCYVVLGSMAVFRSRSYCQPIWGGLK